MRSQGALKSLMAILGDGAPPPYNLQGSKRTSKHSFSTGTRLATKIDIMETVCKVLFQNSANQSEFKAMDGYSVLLRVFDEIVVPVGSSKHLDSDALSISHGSTGSEHLTVSATGELSHRDISIESESVSGLTGGLMSSKRSLLLGSLLAVFFDLTLDGSTRDMVQNTDAFQFLFRLLLESRQLDIRQHALYAIQDLISLNALNAVAAWRTGQVDLLIGKLRECLTVRPRDGTLLDAQWDLGNRLRLDPLNARQVQFGNLSYFGDFIVSEDTAVLADMVEHSSPVYQYVLGLTRLLEYIAVMLVQDNAYILYVSSPCSAWLPS